MTREAYNYNGDHSPMTNEQRAYIGRHLLSHFRLLCCESDINEDTARDTICDILHAAVADGHLKVDQLEQFCRSCVDLVEEELAEARESGCRQP